VDIHVVCRDWGVSDKILPRLAQVLVEQNGWTAGPEPRKDAELNYFIVYIDYAERWSDWHFTPVAAYFTHYDESGFRPAWWKMASSTVDLRITTAQQYLAMLEPCGPSAKVDPPVDRILFRPMEKKFRGTIPVVGVSGWVYPGGRKGEELVERLKGSALGRKIHLRASGEGWPVEDQRRRSVAELPQFYNDLDVYLCTSLIEGNPMSPLEALACEVPVVVPRGVGMMDELPNLKGIYRYDRGEYGSMQNALRKAVTDVLDPAELSTLRRVTQVYTPGLWAAGHAVAFDELLGTGPMSQVESSRHGKRGLYCVAYGEQARDCATGMIHSFREWVPGVEVAVASDTPLGAGEDHFVKCEDVDIGGRYAKTKIFELTPEDWQYVLYLDADTEVVADISFLYQVLEDGYDFVICTNPGKYHTARKMVRMDNKDECEFTFSKIGTSEVIQLNGGVFGFQRNPRTREFFRLWHDEWAKWGKRDQAALLRALWRRPLKMQVLTNVWNTITRYVEDPRSYTAGILHYPMTARRWRGMIEGRSDSEEAWKAVAQFERGVKK